jgi:hypothetical protein
VRITSAARSLLVERLVTKILALWAEMNTLRESSTTEELLRDPTKLHETQARISEIERELANAHEEWANWQ